VERGWTDGASPLASKADLSSLRPQEAGRIAGQYLVDSAHCLASM
jgi:hypothetical protein